MFNNITNQNNQNNQNNALKFKLIRKICYIFFLGAFSLSVLAIGIKEYFLIGEYHTYHFNQGTYCQLSFSQNRLSEDREQIYNVLVRTLLKPNHIFLRKAFKPDLNINQVSLLENHLIIDFNRAYLELSEKEETMVYHSILLGIKDNFPKIKWVSFIFNGRVVERIHQNYSYLQPFDLTEFNLLGVSVC